MPATLPTPFSTGAWDLHQQQAQTSEAAQMKDSSLDPYSCSPPLCMHSGLAPPAVLSHTADLMPFTGLHCGVCTCGKILSPWKYMPVANVPTAVCGPRSGPVSYYWPVPLGSPATNPSTCVPVHPWADSGHSVPLLFTCDKIQQPQ